MGTNNFKVVFAGGMQAGLIGLLSVISSGCKILCVIPADRNLQLIALELGLKCYGSVIDTKNILRKSDLYISVHSKEIVPAELLALPKYGAINVHPCLSEYKGKEPIKRLLEDGGKWATLGVHIMTDVVDEGRIIAEGSVWIGDAKTETEVYNILYPHYSIMTLLTLKLIKEKGVALFHYEQIFGKKDVFRTVQ